MAQSLRQAYDYWQNQPGTYCKPERRNECANPQKRPDVPDGNEKPKLPEPQASEAYKTPKSRTTDSIVPTEFPKLRSATGGTWLLYYLLPRYRQTEPRHIHQPLSCHIWAFCLTRVLMWGIVVVVVLYLRPGIFDSVPSHTWWPPLWHRGRARRQSGVGLVWAASQ